MNILIIGNGFDLAHGFPTSYKDFLDFITAFKKFKEYKINREIHIDNNIFSSYLDNLYTEKRTLFDELSNLIENNSWIKHFEQTSIKNQWVDFEKEISEVIQIFDKIRKLTEKRNLTDGPLGDISNHEKRKLDAFEYDIVQIMSEGISDNRKKLLYDLNRLTHCLEIYLSDYVENKSVDFLLPDIQALQVDHVLSFNYTHTYEKIYQKAKNHKIEYDYIHGDTNVDHTLESCNLILGIDEYQKGYEKDLDNVFIEFKKFYQRIYKRTGCKYIDWIGGINEHDQLMVPAIEDPNNIYIFGHSLDITDGDILSKLINMPNTKITIYYHDKEALSKYIQNLVKILGEDELISMVHGMNAKILFCKQQK